MSKGSNNRINIEDFITVFLETDDTINFRIQMDRGKKQEMVDTIEEIKYKI